MALHPIQGTKCIVLKCVVLKYTRVTTSTRNPHSAEQKHQSSHTPGHDTPAYIYSTLSKQIADNWYQ